MEELKVAKWMIAELMRTVELKTIENKCANGGASDWEIHRFVQESKQCPERFERRELEQMIRTVIKLTGKRDLTAEQIAQMINVDKSDLIEVGYDA